MHMLELLALLMQQCLFFLGYITGRSEFPPALNRAEEAELIGKLDAGDHNARQELITHNLRLVSHIARKYQIPGYGADDLISIGCKILTIGQYLQPTHKHFPVAAYITPEQFAVYKETGLKKGFEQVESAPLVRSSYHAEKHIRFNNK